MINEEENIENWYKRALVETKQIFVSQRNQEIREDIILAIAVIFRLIFKPINLLIIFSFVCMIILINILM